MKIHQDSPTNRLPARGFTLVELLVVITIIIVLAGVTMAVTGRIKDRAMAATRLSNVRQAGMLLLGKAGEMSGRCSYFYGGSGGFDFRPYLIVRGELGIAMDANYICEIMHWDIKRLPPTGNPHWNCYAVNFTDVPVLGAKWINETLVDWNNRSSNVKSLSVASITRPEAYPLLVDSSEASGQEIFRLQEGSGNCVGLRNSGKANAFMFDGSARLMDKTDLKKAGFAKAYDNSTTPPKLITL
jgi:prepilin-type N-terminal cleavage/methylation domain-containing protein/prepilin-type processing-associated H-X9-DG protein